MSADIHTTAPRRGVTDERQRGSRQGRLADLTGSQPAVATTGQTTLRWAEDSRTMPVISREQPRLRQIMGVCGWAAVLGVIGLAVGIRALVADVMNETPSWYEPMMIGVGLTGIALTVGAFVSVHRRRTPYILLGAATVVLSYAMFLTAQAL